MKKGIAAVLTTGALLLAALPVFAKNSMGFAYDPSNTWLGEIRYLFNPSGYQFWFKFGSVVGAGVEEATLILEVLDLLAKSFSSIKLIFACASL